MEAVSCSVPPAQTAPPLPAVGGAGIGLTVTVTVGAFVDTQPVASVTVSVYVVVEAGEAVGEQLAALDSPVAGAHAQDVPPEPESGVVAPAQIAAVPEATAVGVGLIVTTAAPEDVPAQCVSETPVTVYVVVAPGLTERVAGEAAMPAWTTPSDQVTVHGPAPVRAAWIGTEPPAHTAPEPETTAVGFGTTVTVTVGALVDTQPVALVTVSVYVVVAPGEAAGEQLDGSERPVAGAQEQDVPPEPESGAADPSQIVAVPDATAVGAGLTVTTALPADVPAQCESETLVTV